MASLDLHGGEEVNERHLEPIQDTTTPEATNV
jgi:hypothetical protein